MFVLVIGHHLVQEWDDNGFLKYKSDDQSENYEEDG